MKLKSIEINGFKSFADKTVIDFMPGMTGVVGPNGSGKSNIIEAIRWVMGEQSAKGLRGDKMVDVIFGGSKNRNAMSRASVTMNIDNSDHFLKTDFNEVQIVRRLYRNGDSEYLINGVKSRLKDITDLFVDTGLGRESFSIINQGKVEEIFNAKPEDRRAIIEDVAGVFKYKQNKQRSENELATTSENLSRVNDIISEIEGRLEPLKQQSSQAIEFQELQKKHDELNLVRNIRQRTEFENQINKLTENIKQTEIELLKTDSEISEIANFQTEKQNKITEIENSINQLSIKIENQTANLERSKGENNLRNNKLETLNNERERLSSEIEKINISSQQFETELNVKNIELTSKKTKLEIDQKALDDFYSKNENSDQNIKTNQLNELREKYVSSLVEVSNLENASKTYQRDNERLNTRLIDLSSQFAQLEEQLEIDRTEFDKFSKTEVNQTAFADTQNNSEAILVDLNKRNQELDSLKRIHLQLVNTFNQNKARFESLKNSTENSEYYFGVKNILKIRNDFPGLFGTVAELITVDPKNITAVETALGAALQNLIVDNEQTAKRAVNYLTERKLGRATFLPIETIKSRKIDDRTISEIKNKNGFIGVASDLAPTDNKFQEVIENLIGNTVVANDLDSAFVLSKSLNRKFPIVTLDGQIVRAGGAITGGADKNQSGILKKSAEIEELRLTVEEQNSKVEESQNIINKLENEALEIQNNYVELRNQVTAQKEEIQLSIGGKKLAEDRLESTTTTFDRVEKEINQIKSDIQNNNNDLIETNNELEAKAARSEEILAKVNSLELEVSTFTNAGDDAQSKTRDSVTALKIEITNLESRILEIQNILKENAEQKISLNKSLDENNNLIFDLEDETINDQFVNDIDDELKNNIDERQVKNEDLIQLRKELQEFSNKNSELQEQFRKQTNQKNSIEVKLSSLETRIEQIDLTLTNLEYDANSELDIDLQLDTEIEEISKNVNSIKQELAKFTHVNLGAIDELEIVTERFEFLTKQRDDLINASNDLKTAIESLDKEVIEKFGETFKKVALQFEKTFVKLFNGGQASLQLTDPKDLLHTGIEILVQPPGKKARNLSLLSGGEKALTAIALLLAILLVKPVPFAILDETEAALDEANVDNFGRFIYEFGKQTQFIVITHRKPTMKYANILYGVTMQEPGVSTMISVSLDEVSIDGK